MSSLVSFIFGACLAISFSLFGSVEQTNAATQFPSLKDFTASQLTLKNGTDCTEALGRASGAKTKYFETYSIETITFKPLSALSIIDAMEAQYKSSKKSKNFNRDKEIQKEIRLREEFSAQVEGFVRKAVKEVNDITVDKRELIDIDRMLLRADNLMFLVNHFHYGTNSITLSPKDIALLVLNDNLSGELSLLINELSERQSSITSGVPRLNPLLLDEYQGESSVYNRRGEMNLIRAIMRYLVASAYANPGVSPSIGMAADNKIQLVSGPSYSGKNFLQKLVMQSNSVERVYLADIFNTSADKLIDGVRDPNRALHSAAKHFGMKFVVKQTREKIGGKSVLINYIKGWELLPQ